MTYRALAIVIVAGLLAGFALGGCDQKAPSAAPADLAAPRPERHADPVDEHSSGVHHCLLGAKVEKAKCAEYARGFADDLIRWGRRAPDSPTVFDCKQALQAAHRFAPEKRAPLAELCCPLKGENARDDDGTALCDAPKVKP